MRIGHATNGMSCEFEMQDEMEKWLETKDVIFIREHYVKEVGRIADFAIIHKDKVINIEAKSNDFQCMLEQLNDHAIYCDYSFAFIPDWSLTPIDFKNKLAEKRYGLIIYNTTNETITEVLEAHYNKPRNKDLRKTQKSLIKHKYQKQILINTSGGKVLK